MTSSHYHEQDRSLFLKAKFVGNLLISRDEDHLIIVFETNKTLGHFSSLKDKLEGA